MYGYDVGPEILHYLPNAASLLVLRKRLEIALWYHNDPPKCIPGLHWIPSIFLCTRRDFDPDNVHSLSCRGKTRNMIRTEVIKANCDQHATLPVSTCLRYFGIHTRCTFRSRFARARRRSAALHHATRSLALPEGERFPSSPKGTLSHWKHSPSHHIE